MKRDYLWNTIGVFAQNAISPLLLVAITRINGIFDSGLFSFAFSMSIIFWAFGMWGGRTYQVSDTKQEFSHKSYITVRFILAIFMLFGAVVFSFVNHYDATKSAIIISLVLFKVIESIADAIYGILQVHNRLYIVGKSLLYKAISGFVLFFIIDISTKSILLSSLSVVAVNIFIVIFYDLNVANKFENLKISTGQISMLIKNASKIMKRCAPVFAVMFLAMFSLNIPRYFIDMYHQEEVGYFGIIAMPITLIVLLMSFILQPNVVNLSILYENKRYLNFKKIVKRITLATLVIGIIILFLTTVVGVQSLQVVFGVDFSSHWTTLVVIVAGGVVNAIVTVLINVLVIIRRIKSQFFILLSTNILLLVTSVIFIPKYGLLAGVSLFAIINIIQAVLLLVAYKLSLKAVENA